MKDALFQNKLSVKKSPIHGYGVFAEKNISKDEIVEECYGLISDTCAASYEDYCFYWKDKFALLLGYGSIYNHAENYNAIYEFDFARQVAIFRANRTIFAGEEIFIHYGDNWFGPRALKAKKISAWRRIFDPRNSSLLRGALVSCVIVGGAYLLKAFLS